MSSSTGAPSGLAMAGGTDAADLQVKVKLSVSSTAIPQYSAESNNAAVTSVLLPKPLPPVWDDGQVRAFIAREASIVEPLQGLCFAQPPTAAVPAEVKPDLQSPMSMKERRASLSALKQQSNLRPPPLARPEPSLQHFPFEDVLSGAAVQAGLAKAAETQRFLDDVELGRARAILEGLKDVQDLTPDDLSVTPIQTTAPPADFCKDFRAVLVLPGAQTEAAALLAAVKDRLDDALVAQSRAQAAPPTGGGPGKDKGAGGKGQPAQDTTPQKPVEPAVLRPVVPTDCSGFPRLLCRDIVVPTAGQTPVAGPAHASGTDTASSTARATSPSTAAASPTGVAQPPASPGKSRRHKKGSSQALWVPPVVIDPREHRPYDVPAWLQSAMAAFAAAVRVIGTPAGAASLPKGAWLWEAIQPSAVPTKVFDASGAVEPRLFHVRVFWAGAWRRVTVDDQVPVTLNGYPLYITSADCREVWPLVLWKAWWRLVVEDAWSLSLLAPGTSAAMSAQAEAQDQALIVHALTGWLPMQLPIQLSPDVDPSKLQALFSGTLPENVPTHGEQLREWAFQSESAAIQWLKQVETTEISRRQAQQDQAIALQEAGKGLLPGEEGVLLGHTKAAEPTTFVPMSEGEASEGQRAPVVPLPSLEFITMSRPILPAPVDAAGSVPAQPLVLMATCSPPGEGALRLQVHAAAQGKAGAAEPHPLPLPVLRESAWASDHLPSEAHAWQAEAGSRLHLVQGDSYMLVMSRDRKVKVRYTVKEGKMSEDHRLQTAAAGTEEPLSPRQPPSAAGKSGKGAAAGAPAPAAVAPTMLPPVSAQGPEASVSHETTGVHGEYVEIEEPVVLVLGRKFRAQPTNGVSASSQHRLHLLPATDHVDQIEQIVAQGFDASVKVLMQHAKASGVSFPLAPSPLSSSSHASGPGLTRVPTLLERTLGLASCAVSSQGLQEQSTLLKPLQSVPAALSAAGVERGPGQHDDGEAYPTELLACADLVVTTDPALPSHPAWRDPTAVEAWIPLSQLGAYFQGPLHMFMNSWANAQVVENVPVVSEESVSKEAAAAKAKAEAEAAAAAAALPTGKKGAAAPTLRAAQTPESAAHSAVDIPAHDADKTGADTLRRIRTLPSLHTINRHWMQAWAGEAVQPGVDGSDQPLAVPVKPVQADVVAPVSAAPTSMDVKSSPVKGKGPGPAAPAAAPSPTLQIRAPLTQHLPPGPFVKLLSSTAADQCVYIPRLSSVLGSDGSLLCANGGTGLGIQRIAVMVWRDALDVGAVPYPLSADASTRTPVTVTLSKDEILTSLVSKVPTNGTGGLAVAVTQGFVVNTERAQEQGVLAPGMSTQGQARVSLTLQPPSLHGAQESARPLLMKRYAVAVLEVQHESADAAHATSCGTVYRVALQGGDTGACCMLLPLPPVRPGYSFGISERDLPAVVPTTLRMAKVPLVYASAVSEPISKPIYPLYTPSAATLGHNALFTSPLMSVGPVARVCAAACGVSTHVVQGIAEGLAAGEDLMQAARVQAALTLAARGGSGSSSEADMELIESTASSLASSTAPWCVWHRHTLLLSWIRPPTQTVKVKVKKMVTKKEALALQGGQDQAGPAANRPPSALKKGGPAPATAPASPAPGAPKAAGGPVAPGATAAPAEPEEMVEIEVEEERPGAPEPVEGGIRLYAKLDVLNAHAAPFVRLFTINHKTGHVRAHGGLTTGIVAIDMGSNDGVHAAQTTASDTTSASVFARKEGTGSTYVVPPLAQSAPPQQTESAPLAVVDAPVPVSNADVASKGASPSVPDVARLLADARAALLSLTKVHLEEIRSLNRPPDAIADVLSAVLLLLGIQDTSWGSMRIFLARRGVIEDILSYDPGKMSKGTRSQVRKVLKSKAKSFEPEVILRASKAAAPLAAWVKAVMAGQNTAVRGRPLSSAGKRSARAAAGEEDEEGEEEEEEEEDEDAMAGMEGSGLADVGSSAARSMAGITGVTADADASLGSAERGVSTASPSDSAPARDPAVLQEEECVSVVVASCLPSSLAAAGNCGVNPAQLGGPWCLTIAHARGPSRRELATCAAAVSAQQHPVQALLSLPVTACTTVPAEPATLTRVQVGSGCSVEPPVVFTCTGHGEVGTAGPTQGMAVDAHGQDGAVPALPAFLRRAASPAQPLTPVPLFRWMSSLHPTVRPSQVGLRVDLVPGHASPPAGALQKIHVALEVLHADDGRVLGKCSGRGAAELLSLPAAVRGLLPFHPTSAPGASSSKATGHEGAETPGSLTTGALKSPAGKDKPAARPDSSSGTKGAAAKATADVPPAPTTSTLPPSGDGEGAPGMKLHPWIARANAEVNWMDAAREHVRAYSRAQENAVLAGAQFILQATAYVPAASAGEQGWTQIPWRVAIAAPALQAPAPVPASGEAPAAPFKPGTAKAPSRPGTAAKAEVHAPAATMLTPAGDGNKVQMPAAPFSGLKLQAPTVSDAHSPVKLWQDDRASRLAAGVTVALAECGLRGVSVRSSQGAPAEDAPDTKGAKGAKPPAKAASKAAEKPTEEPGARKSVPALPCPLPSVPLLRVELTSAAAAACPPVRTDTALAALPYITMADAQAAISAAQPLFESYSKQAAERPASATGTGVTKAATGGAPAKPAPAAAKAGAKAAVGPITMDTAAKEDPLATLARMPLGSALLRSGTHTPALPGLPASMAALAADIAEGKQPEGETGAALASSVLKAKAEVSLASALSNALAVLRQSVAPGGQVERGMWSTSQGEGAGPLVPASLFPASRSLQEISAQWDLSAATPESSVRLLEALTSAMTPQGAQAAAAADACKALASTGVDLSDRDVLAGATRAARRAAASALAQQRVATAVGGKGGVVTSAGAHILHALRPLPAEEGKVLAVAALKGSVTRSALGARAASLLASESGHVSGVAAYEAKAAEHNMKAQLASHAAAQAPAALADTTAVGTVYASSLHASLRREAVARDVALYAGVQGHEGQVSAHAGTA